MKRMLNIMKLSNAQLLALLWGIGIIIGNFIHLSLNMIITITIITTIINLFFRKREVIIFSSLILLAFIRINIANIEPSNSIKNVIDNNKSIQQNITGIISSEVIRDDLKYKFDLELTKIADKEISGKIKFVTKTDSLKIGDEVTGLCKIFQIQKTSNPSSFDYEEFLSKSKIYGYGFSITKLTKIGHKFKFSKIFIQFRKLIRRKINTSFPIYKNFVKAIIIGERENLDELRLKMSKAGLSHILAVSGLHTGLISFILLILLNIVIWKKNIVRIIIVILLFIYAGLCNWSPSVTRAMIMINIYLLAKISQRDIKTIDTLAFSFIFMTVLNPMEMFSIGFQMSFIAVLVLLNSSTKFSFLNRKKDEKFISYSSKNVIKAVLSVMYFSLILNIFLAPLTLYNFNQVSFNGIVSNILGIFLISIILPLALLVLVLPTGIFLFDIYHQSFAFMMNIFFKWVDFAAELPLNFQLIKFGKPEFLASIIFLIVISYTIKFSLKKRYILPFSIFLFSVFLFYQNYDAHSENLKITCFDCKLGDLHLIQQNGFSLMIDTGPTKESQGYFKNSALPYFQKNGLKELDYLVITHAHNDHYGGYDCLLENIFVRNIILTDEFQEREIYSKIKNAIDPKSNVITLSDTTSIINGDLKIKFLHPDKNFHHENINNVSIVCRIDFHKFSALFTGDLEFEGEDYLLENYREFLDVDFLKIGHHGSKTASSFDFLTEVSPEYCFISTSLKNRFDFPHEETMQKLRDFQLEIFLSGKDGALQIVTDGEKACFKTILSNKEILDYEI